MTRKIIKPLKIALFGFIVSLILCFCVGAVSVNDYYSENVNDNYYFLTDDNSMFEYSYIWVDSDYNFAFIVAWSQSDDYIEQGFTFSIVNTELYVKYIDDNITLSGSDTEKNEQIYNLISNLSFTHNFVVPNTIWNYKNSYYNIYKSYKDNYSLIYSYGYSDGVSDGYSNGFSDGYSDGVSDGYSNGFTEGTYNGMQESEALKGGLLTILSAPFYVLGGILDFDILGINLLDIFTGLLTLCLFAFVVKKLINGGV